MFVSTRRAFLKAAAAGVAAPCAFAQSPKFTTTQLGENLYMLSGAGCNVIAHTGAEGVSMVDGGRAQNASALAQAGADFGSNEALGMAGATIIAQENTRLWLQQNITWPYNGQKFKKLPKIAQPNKTFYDKGVLDSGIRYGYIPDAAHTDGDLYVYFPQQNVLAVGDAAYGEGWPVIDWWTGGWIGGIVGGLQRIQAIANLYGNRDTKIVPAQGPVLTLTDIAAQAEMYSTIYDRLNQMLNKGRGPSEAVEAKPAKEFEARMGNPDAFIRRAFESQWAYLSPDA
jgi:glyoxylase-like metal-dependent hydrolase (beta-lactamase superfamily II)